MFNNNDLYSFLFDQRNNYGYHFADIFTYSHGRCTDGEHKFFLRVSVIIIAVLKSEKTFYYSNETEMNKDVEQLKLCIRLSAKL